MSATMESTNMEENASTENGTKISDSGYSNTCSNSQSHMSSGSSVSRNSNRPESSGYHEGNPSTLGSCTETLPKPITTKRKETSYKKQKSKNTSSSQQQQHSQQQQQTIVEQQQQPQQQTIAEQQQQQQQQQQHHNEAIVVAQASVAVAEAPVAAAAAAAAAAAVVAAFAAAAVTDKPCKPMILDKTAEDAAGVELVDAADLGVHNDNNLMSGSKAGLTSKINPLEESSLQSTDDYYVVISMNDGLVVHATPSLYASLGYAKNSWTGKLFTDFLDPKDKHILTERIASEIAISRDICSQGTNGRKASIFCRLRRSSVPNACGKNGLQQHQHHHQHYHQHHQHESHQSNAMQYMPFRVNVVIQNFNGDKLSAYEKQVLLLVATFQPVLSAYKVPEETIIPTVFTTRHTATCHLSYVDPDVVQYLGYLPQDMIDRSLFDFYYPEDLPLIKDIYETVINLESSSFISKPYRFIVQNGDFVVLETEWSSFINPWTKSLEFVVGKHRVLKGPADPNVFRPVGNRKANLLAGISEEVLKEAKVIEKEICALLVEGVQRKSAYPIADNSNLLSKKSELASFVENILQEIKSHTIKDHMAVDEQRFSEHDSVMLGAISPHHEYLDSRSSTETPPSYNQLNYHENIERFFNSNIGTSANNRPYGSDEENQHSSVNSSDERGKNNASRPELKCTSSTNGSGNSGSGENLSSESNNLQSFGSRQTSNTTSNNSSGNDNNATRTPLPLLTESLLNKHNEDMEKLMMQKHREQKKGDKRNKSSLIEQFKADQPSGRGEAANNKSLKRSASKNWDGDNNYNKLSKNDETAIMLKTKQHNLNKIQSISNANVNMQNMANSNPNMQHMGNSTHNVQNVPNSSINCQNLGNSNTNINVWSSMAMPPTTTIASQNQVFSSQNQAFAPSNASSQALPRSYPQMQYPQMFPWFYMPVPQPWNNPAVTVQECHRPPNPVAQVPPYCFAPVSYIPSPMPGMMYPPIIGTPAPTTVTYRSFTVPESVPTTPLMNAMPQVVCPPKTKTAPPTVGPTTTTANSFDLKRPASRETSVKAETGSTMAMSENSKKIFSPSGVVSSCVSNEGGCFFGCSLNKSCNSCSSSSITNNTTNKTNFESYCNGGTNANVNGSGSKQSCASQKSLPRKEPFWIEGVKLTPELMYQYQLEPSSISEILKADLDFLKNNRQPSLVNDQLGQLFLDLDLEGFGSKLIIDDVNSSSSTSDNSSDGSQSPSRMGAW